MSCSRLLQALTAPVPDVPGCVCRLVRSLAFSSCQVTEVHFHGLCEQRRHFLAARGPWLAGQAQLVRHQVLRALIELERRLDVARAVAREQVRQ